MPAGEEMFKFHGYSGPCPAPIKPLSMKHAEVIAQRDELLAALRNVRAHTSYFNPTMELLKGLLESIERIADAAIDNAESK